ncbi:MAG TPA: DUF86 domain-containing protein [Bacilli bacterium]
MTTDIIINKTESIKRCIQRIREEYDGKPANLNNYTKQDSIILNLQRACEAAIDLAMHVVSEKGYGVPQSSRDVFEMLRVNLIINDEISLRMKAMVGFRNIAVHDYRAVQLEIIQSIIEQHLEDFVRFADLIKKV